MEDQGVGDWIRQARARGWGNAISLMLDVLEPLGVLGAQLVLTAQPALGLFINRDALGALAEALETPGGIDNLRAQLESDE